MGGVTMVGGVPTGGVSGGVMNPAGGVMNPAGGVMNPAGAR